MSKSIGELMGGEKAGTLTENEKSQLSDLRESAIKFGRCISTGFSELIRSVDPHRRREFAAALIVAGRRRCIPIYDTKEFILDMAQHINNEIDGGGGRFLSDLNELSGMPDAENRQCLILTSLLDFYGTEERWPTIRESEEHALKLFPMYFGSIDEKEWRRLRKATQIDWLKPDRRRSKRGA